MAIALTISFVVNLFVVCVFSSAYGVQDLDLHSAGDYLHHRYGEAVKIIWAIGILASGQASTMTGCYAGQFIMSVRKC